MHLLRFIPIQLSLFLIVGILIGHYFNIDVALPAIGAVVGLSVLGFLHFNTKRRNLNGFPIVLWITTIFIGALSIAFTFPKNQHGHYYHQDISGQHLWQLKVRTVLKSTSYSNRYVANITGMDSLGVSGKILVSLPLDSTKNVLDVDDELWAYGTLNQVKPPLNPHQFNYKAYLESIGIHHSLYLNVDNYEMVANPYPTLLGLAAKIRSNIITKLEKSRFGPDELGVIQALLLGQRNDISEATYNNYKNAGAVHILAVSGLHIGVLLLLLNFLLKPLKRFRHGKKFKLVLVVLMLWAFALLAGFSASVVRAVTMFSFVAYALYLNRPANIFNILALSMLTILLAIDPKLLFQVGFQMSYAAVFAIVWIYPLLEKLWHPHNRILRQVWQLLSVSLAAQFGVLPISLFYFHQFPSLFFISNLLIVPALGLILGMGILVIFLALLQILPQMVVMAYDTLIRWMNDLVAWVARQEAFIIRDIAFDAVQLILAYGVLICFAWLLEKYRFKRLILFGSTIIAFQLYLFLITFQTQKKQEFLVAHQTRNTVLIHQSGDQLMVMAKDTASADYLATDYKIGEYIHDMTITGLHNSYTWRGKKLLVIDSSGVYNVLGVHPDYILLTQSPRLNLERAIDTLKPQIIIADGSNYTSDVSRWAQTCQEKGIPFHYTGEKGGYYFSKGP